MSFSKYYSDIIMYPLDYLKRFLALDTLFRPCIQCNTEEIHFTKYLVSDLAVLASIVVNDILW